MTALFLSASSRGGDALLVGGDQDRRAVLVGAGDHQHVVAGHPHVPAEDVGGHAETGDVADVARAVGVRPGDGGQDMGHGSEPSEGRYGISRGGPDHPDVINNRAAWQPDARASFDDQLAL